MLSRKNDKPIILLFRTYTPEEDLRVFRNVSSYVHVIYKNFDSNPDYYYFPSTISSQTYLFFILK